MSKTWEHYHHAARHHEQAAYHFREAAGYEELGEPGKAHHAYLAHRHDRLAVHYDSEAAKLRDGQSVTAATPANEQGVQKQRAT